MDAFDQITSAYSCNCKTRKWPLIIFHEMINSAMSNGEYPVKRDNASAGTKVHYQKVFLETSINEAY